MPTERTHDRTRAVRLAALPLAAALLGACATPAPSGNAAFDDDVAFLARHVATLVLTSPSGARVAVVPAYQGRVMTSTTESGAESFGWINRELVASGRFVEHINVFGGEDRFWMGPEGGQFSVFFAPGAKFELADWHTPAPIDTEPFDLVDHDGVQATFARTFELRNWSGARFHVGVRRQVRLCDPATVLRGLGCELGDLHAVSFETVNTVRNVGDTPWREDTGLLSVWILGMFTASPASTVLVPFLPGTVAERGRIVDDEYFGKVPADRLQIDEARSLILFRGDAGHRGKIGVGPRRARPVMGSWDATNDALTLVEFSLDDGTPARGPRRYVNSQWRLQDDPYGGDVVNSYNDGPLAPGKPGLGNFYELESSSPALSLAPGESAVHVHRTTHLVGPRTTLAEIARHVLGADLAQLDRTADRAVDRAAVEAR